MTKVECMQKTASYARIYIVSLIAVLITGCSYHRPSAVLTPPHEGHEQTQEKVSVRIKPLRDFECSHYFDNRLVSRGIQPVQLYIQNESEHYYVLDGREISLPIMGKRDIGAVYKKYCSTKLCLGICYDCILMEGVFTGLYYRYVVLCAGK